MMTPKSLSDLGVTPQSGARSGGHGGTLPPVFACEGNGALLITGGAGFFGGVLKREALARGYHCVSVDVMPDEDSHPNLLSIQADINDAPAMEAIFQQHRIDAVLHIAAIMAHDKAHLSGLWQTNVEATASLAALAEKYGASHFVFTSSNCLWGRGLGHPVREDEMPEPVEVYGHSKWAAEKILANHNGALKTITIRCPTIIDSGRLGLLTLLFDFIREHKKVWVVGGGSNRYQFIYARDLADACLRALTHTESDLFHIGSDDVPTLKEVYDYVIKRAGTRARVAGLPKAPTLFAMRLAHTLGLSPLGPYHYRMIAESFVFDTSRIKARLGWQPSLTNAEMMWRAYEYYVQHLDALAQNASASVHRKPASMGIIRLLKWLS